jgi:hypothetical protein
MNTPPDPTTKGAYMSDHKVASQRLGLWCSWIFVALTAIGWLGIVHLHMPARADLGLDATKVWFSETHHWGVIVGCTGSAASISRPSWFMV